MEGWSFCLSLWPDGWEESLSETMSGGTLETLKNMEPCTHPHGHTHTHTHPCAHMLSPWLGGRGLPDLNAAGATCVDVVFP